LRESESERDRERKRESKREERERDSTAKGPMPAIRSHTTSPGRNEATNRECWKILESHSQRIFSKVILNSHSQKILSFSKGILDRSIQWQERKKIQALATILNSLLPEAFPNLVFKRVTVTFCRSHKSLSQGE